MPAGMGKRAGQWMQAVVWRGEAPLVTAVLAPLSLLYRGAVGLRSLLYARGVRPSHRLSRPVISVGNLAAGGTGKTPLVIRIVRRLGGEGLRAAVLSRGYRGTAGERVNIVSDAERLLLDAAQAGDEPYLLARELPGTPVLTGRDRFLAGSEAIRRFDVDVLVLDDGFQHLRLRRDVNLLLLDGERPWGNGWCLPAGPLREGPGALQRADMVLTSGPASGEAEGIRGRAGDRPVHRMDFVPAGLRREPFGEVEPLEWLRGKRVLAFAGIARPERFFASVQEAGVEVCIPRSFPDHHSYSRAEIQALRREAEVQKADCLVTTDKDRVRLTEWTVGPPLVSLVLGVAVEEEEDFFRRVLARMAGAEGK